MLVVRVELVVGFLPEAREERGPGADKPWKNRAGSLSSSKPLTKQTTAQHEATKASRKGRVRNRAAWPFGARLFHHQR